MDRTLPGATIPSQSGPGSNGNERVLLVPQSPSITGTSPSDGFVPYPGHSLEGGLTPLQRCSRFILQLQPTGQNGSGDQGSIPGRVIPKTEKIVLNAALLNSQHYKVQINVKWSNQGKGVAPSSIPRCCSYWKRSFRVAFDYGRQLYYVYN